MLKVALITLFAALALLNPAMQAEQASPLNLYTKALALERQLREPSQQPSLKDFRSGIAAYEMVWRRYPRNPYVHHALWQASGLAVEAYDRFRDNVDLKQFSLFLRTLEENHPASPLTSRVSERRRRLNEIRRLAWINQIDSSASETVTNISISLDRSVNYRSAQLQSPPRLFFDFPLTEAAPHLSNSTLTVQNTERYSNVHSIRLGRHPDNMTRVVLDLEASTSCSDWIVPGLFKVLIECTSTEHSSVNGRPAIHAAVIPPATVPPSPVPPPAVFRSELELLHGKSSTATLQSSLLNSEDLTIPATPGTDLISSKLPENVHVLKNAQGNQEYRELDSIKTFSIARQLGLNVSRIVIDAGHGGHDPGARAQGLSEANVVLDIAQRLAARLTDHPGLEAVLTRNDDSYLPLRARTTFANRVQADLFLSIHANASRNINIRGVETYFLDLATDPNGQQLATRENLPGINTMHDLDALLQLIAANSKLNESRVFATTVQHSLLRTLRTADPEMPDLGVKHAPFVVLIGAQMPSILAEVSFVTNPTDATLLSTDAYRDLIVDALFTGILRYRHSLSSAPLLAMQTSKDSF